MTKHTQGEDEIIPSKESDMDDQPPSDIEEIERERLRYLDMAQRAQANLDNFKRRAEDEKAEIRRTANANLIRDLLGVVDDFDRAFDMVPPDADTHGWLDGLSLVRRKFMSILQAQGVTKIDALGKPFDPWEHEAILHQETADAEDNSVIEVYRDGYRLRDRVLRASQVIVAKAPDIEPDELDAHPS